MCLTHTFFIYYFGAFQKYVFALEYAELILPAFTLFSLVIAVLIDWFYGGASKGIGWIRMRFAKKSS